MLLAGSMHNMRNSVHVHYSLHFNCMRELASCSDKLLTDFYSIIKMQTQSQDNKVWMQKYKNMSTFISN